MKIPDNTRWWHCGQYVSPSATFKNVMTQIIDANFTVENNTLTDPEETNALPEFNNCYRQLLTVSCPECHDEPDLYEVVKTFNESVCPHCGRTASTVLIRELIWAPDTVIRDLDDMEPFITVGGVHDLEPDGTVDLIVCDYCGRKVN